MKRSFLLLLCSMAARLAEPLQAQADEALRATSVSDYIVVAPANSNSKALRYSADNNTQVELFHSILPDHIFATRNRREVGVRAAYLNPLKFSWSMAVTNQREPLLSSVDEFLKSATQLFALVGGAPPTPGSEVRLNEAGMADPQANAVIAAKGLDERPSSAQLIDPSLLEWQWQTQSNRPTIEAIATLVNDATTEIAAFDAMLYSDAVAKDFTVVTTAAEFRTLARATVADLLGADSMDSLRVSLKRARSRVDLMKTANTTAHRQSDQLIKLAERFEKASQTPDNRPYLALLGYSARVMRGAVVRASDFVDAREGLVKQLSAVLEELQRKVPSNEKQQDFVLGDVAVVSGERATVTISLTTRKVEITSDGVLESEGTVSQARFGLMEKQSWLTEFTQGIAYVNVAFPQYKTNADPAKPTEHVVADAGSNRPRAMAVAMFNIMPNFGSSGFTQPIVQIGMGLTTEAPLIAGGFGFRFSKPTRFSIVFGGALPIIQELRTLKLGDSVGGEAALKQDIARTLSQRGTFYIGVQR